MDKIESNMGQDSTFDSPWDKINTSVKKACKEYKEEDRKIGAPSNMAEGKKERGTEKGDFWTYVICQRGLKKSSKKTFFWSADEEKVVYHSLQSKGGELEMEMGHSSHDREQSKKGNASDSP